ncbi:MAG: ThuA domain-containing protein [Tepidisphaeraceae bacterium]
MKHLIGFAALLLFTSTAPAATPETWADPALPVKDGLTIWLDASRQPAAAGAHGATLKDGDAITTCYDASGNGRDFSQQTETARPTFSPGAIRFDGKDDHLLRDDPTAKPLAAFTVVMVVTPRSNAGQYRAFLSASAKGKNDFQAGLNVDMGPEESNKIVGFDDFNVEGSGFGGAVNLFDQTVVAFDDPQSITITAAASGAAEGAGAIKCYLHGKLTGQRKRDEASRCATELLVVGARYTSLGAAQPSIRSVLHGDVTEILIFDRVLTDAERKAIDDYLIAKHPALAESAIAAAEAEQTGSALLQRVEKPPVVQMFVPGFVARELPIDLSNINNLRYRDDGKLVAMAYDGNVYLLSDTDGDGLEDKVERYWDNQAGVIVQPIGIALTPPDYPHGRGLFIACKGKLALLTDSDGDNKLDKETVVASGWPPSFVNVDALGVAIDPKDQSVYFGVGTTNFADPYVKDKNGDARFDIKGERGTILRVAPDLKSRKIVCTGVRFSVGLAFNAAGDLFASDQEGATWAPNGNPFDELLHIQPGRHYGFPARHPKHLPGVIDEPSTFDFGPQHQSTCGLTFNESPPLTAGPTFGPANWGGDAIVCGESRGKLYRTKLTRTPAGYVAGNQLITSVSKLLIDATISPRGDLVLCTHSGDPDWGSGPTGKGKLYQIRYAEQDTSQPVAAWPAGPGEVRVAFDRPLDPAALAGIAKNVTIDAGRYVAAGDRFETIRPGYAVVRRQMRARRDRVDVGSVQVARDGRTLVIGTSTQRQAIGYAITLPRSEEPRSRDDSRGATPRAMAQHPQTDLAYDLSGVIAEWKSRDGKTSWSGWLPHPDLAVSRALTAGSAEHDALWVLIKTPGKLTIRTSLDLQHMLQPRVQAGSQIDFTPAAERVTVSFAGSSPIELRAAGQAAMEGKFTFTPTLVSKSGEFVPVELSMSTSATEPALGVSFITQEDPTPRPMALRRFYVPWAKPAVESDDELASPEPIPQLTGGDWHRGRQLFFGIEAGCSKCHAVRGQGSDLGPDLSNLIHRDYESVLRDIRDPSAALNPDYLSSQVLLKDGRLLAGIVRDAGKDHFTVRGDSEGERTPLARGNVKKVTALPLSVMPTGLPEGLGEAKMRDLMTFMLTEPLAPAPILRKGAPPPRSRAEIEAVMKASLPSTQPSALRPLSILLVAGPKDHGPSEHDYPEWQKRWATLLALAEDVKVTTANEWPAQEQWQSADVAVFYSANPGWTAPRGAELDAFLARGGGLVYLHYAVNGRDAPEALAQRIGLASRPGGAFRHGPVDLAIRDADHPITRGFGSVHFVDETYWNMLGDPTRIHLLADAVEEGRPRPQLWTMEHGKGRVFVSILGHYNWTFDDPLFRILVLRGICWTAGEDADRLSGLTTIGARVR